ncbi:hypothetical protein DKX38_005873 [Salix brachista]|uniref:Uncharacterized protein n=1 Tax=Salix brachista TaxID=2182728 RepID=A0A5N5N3V9_9ROSI|nr:hypothetical protein DKX38_005873 [Salix brachista]
MPVGLLATTFIKWVWISGDETDPPNVEDDNGPRDTVNIHRRRQTSFPSWIRDYVSGDELSEEETGFAPVARLDTAVMSPMVPGYKVGQNEDSNRVDETYYKWR